MADGILIEVKLDPVDIPETGKEIVRQLSNALDTGVVSAKEAGRKIGDALNAGMREALQRAQQLRQQLDAAISPDQRHSSSEAKERAHQQRLQAIHEQSAARLREIEARRQSQLEAIRERAVQREIDQQRRLERAAQSGATNFQAFLRRHSSTIREAGESIQQAGFAALGLTGLIVGLGKAAFQSAVDIDRQVNVIKALTGSTEQAEKRFAQLVATAQKSPGLTTQLAATLDAQLRTLSVTEQTINRVLPAVGRLNAIAPLADPGKFVGNLVQLVTQNFERQDLKELVGQSPLAGELIKQIFNVDSPTNAKAIREAAQKLGIRTTEDFFTAFANAAATNQKLQGVTESLGAQFDKLRDRVIVALRPLGLTLIETLKPIIEAAIPTIERLSKAFASLPEPVRQAIIVIGAFAAAAGPVIILLGGLIQAFGALGNIVTVIAGAGGIGALLTAVAPVAALLAVIAAAVIALGLAFATNFGGIRDVAGDVIGFVQARFKDAIRSFEESKDNLAELRKEFNRLSEEVKPLIKALGEVIKNTFENTFRGAILAAQSFVTVITNILRNVLNGIEAVRSALRTAAEGAAQAFGLLVAPGSGLGTVLGGRVRSALGPQPRGTGQGLDGEEVTPDQISAAFERQRQALEAERRRAQERGAGRAANGRGQSEARALRDAQLAADRDFQRNQFELLKDANDRMLREDERSFGLRLITADEFFRSKLGLLQATAGNEINLINSQLIATQEAFNKTKPNTAEGVRLGQQIEDLQTNLTLKTREFGDIEKQVFSESVKARSDVIDLTKKQLDVTEEQGRKEKEIFAAIRSQVEEREALLGAAREALKLRGRELDQQLILVGQNLDLKSLNAQKEALLEIRQLDEQAILSQIRNRERLADASIFHAQRANAIFLDHLARQQSVTEAVADAQIKAFEGVAGSLDRGIDRLTKKLGFFGDVVSGILKSIVRNVLANLLAPTFGGGQQGGGGLLGGILGGVFGGQAGGLLGGIFGRGGIGPGGTPVFNPSGGGFNFGSLFGLAAGSGGISAPPSVSGGLPRFGNLPVPFINSSVTGNVQFPGAGLLGSLGGLFKGFGFGLKPGSQLGGLASIAPLLGLSLGIGAGGTSTRGKILGGAGGALLGIGLTAAPAIFGTGGALASPFIAGLFSNPITAIVGAAALVGAIFLGRASQRRKDEAASGDMLTQALSAIQELKRGISSDQIDGSQARGIFDNQILATFIQQINTLKTKSVRESRLTNQVRDLRKVFDTEIPPEIEAQRKRKLVNQRLIPEFAFGGIVPGIDFGRDSVVAALRPREMVLTLEQQSTIARIAGGDVFARAGVPGVQQQPAFAQGGIVPFASASAPQTIILDVTIGMSQSGAEEIVVNGAQTERAQSVIVRTVRRGQRNRELP